MPERNYNMNHSISELQLMCAGLAELPVKTGAAELIGKLQHLVQAQDQLAKNAKTPTDVEDVDFSSSEDE